MSRNRQLPALMALEDIGMIRQPITRSIISSPSFSYELTERTTELLRDITRSQTRHNIVVGRQETNRSLSRDASAIACTWLQNRQPHESWLEVDDVVSTGEDRFFCSDREASRIRLRVRIG